MQADRVVASAPTQCDSLSGRRLKAEEVTQMMCLRGAEEAAAKFAPRRRVLYAVNHLRPL